MGGMILCLFSTVCRFLSTRIMCLSDYHICTIHSYILQVLLSVLSCPGHVSVSEQQGHSETTLRRCRGSQGSRGVSDGACCMSGNDCECCQVKGQAHSRSGSRGTIPLWSCMVEQA